MRNLYDNTKTRRTKRGEIRKRDREGEGKIEEERESLEREREGEERKRYRVQTFQPVWAKVSTYNQ